MGALKSSPSPANLTPVEDCVVDSRLEELVARVGEGTVRLRFEGGCGL